VPLGSEKFMIDGRHVGTGGGITSCWGADRGREPVPAPAGPAQKPDPYCKRHPSLSYLFSGLFIGRPARPRASTRRATDQLYELEIALAMVRCPAGASRRARGWSIGSSAISSSTSPATPTVPRSASTNCSRPTVRPDGWVWSSSAHSKCCRIRA